MLPQSKTTPNGTLNLLIQSLKPSQLPVFVVKMAWLLFQSQDKVSAIINDSRMSVAYHNKPHVIQGPRSSSVLRMWPISGSEPSSVVWRCKGERRSTCGRFSWTRLGWGTVISVQFSLRTQLHGKPKCKGGWGRGSSCGPKRERKLLHSSSRIKKCSNLLLIPLLASPSASHQVLLVFILWWLSSALFSPPCHFLNSCSPLFQPILHSPLPVSSRAAAAFPSFVFTVPTGTS